MVFSEKGKPLGNEGYALAMRMMEKAYNTGNADGFFIRILGDNIDKRMRSIDIEHFIKWVEKQKQLIQRARKLHIHFRLASSGSVSTENVHGWKYEYDRQKYTASHNGHMQRASSDGRSDSKVYFDELFISDFSLFRKRLGMPNNIENHVKKYGGSGVFQLMGERDEYTWSLGTEAYAGVYYFGSKKILIISSKEDILYPEMNKDYVMFRWFEEHEVKHFGFGFISSIPQKIKINIGEFYWKGQSVIELEEGRLYHTKNGILVESFELEKPYSSYYEHWDKNVKTESDNEIRLPEEPSSEDVRKWLEYENRW